MTTKRYFVCNCPERDYCAELFGALRDLAALRESTCPKCGAVKQLRLVFQFGLDAGSLDCKVLAVFSPPGEGGTWQTEKGETATLVPFLCVLGRGDGPKNRAPYWQLRDKTG